VCVPTFAHGGETLGERRSGTGGLREAQRQLTRERLVDAAVALFGRRGFRAVTIEQIAAEAGANRATFYLHFRNKEDVANAIGDRLVPNIQATFAALDAIPDPSLEDVRAWLAQGMAEQTDERRNLLAVATEANVADPDLADDYLRFINLFIDAMPNYLARFSDAERPAARTRMLMQLVQFERLSYVMVVQRASAPLEPLLDALAESWWRLLTGKCGGASIFSPKLSVIPPLWREPLYRPQGQWGGALARHGFSPSAEPGVPATRAGMTAEREWARLIRSPEVLNVDPTQAFPGTSTTAAGSTARRYPQSVFTVAPSLAADSRIACIRRMSCSLPRRARPSAPCRAPRRPSSPSRGRTGRWAGRGRAAGPGRP
jgi:AcrR family transcriptional regulator